MKPCPVDKELVYKAIKEHKNEILEDCDWWFTVDNYDLNVHCQDDEPFEPDAMFRINLYELDEGETSSYSKQSQYDLPPMTRKEIRLL